MTHVNINGGGSGGYRPKGPPKDQELEDDSGSEAEPGGGIQVSQSVAQQKLKALAERRGIQHNRSQSQGQPQSYRRPPTGLHFTPVAPHDPSPPPSAAIPLGYPYNLPPPEAPSTPRTTRRHMLATEMPESLRRNLLWERQVSKVNLAAVRRSASGGGSRHSVLGGLQPLTAAPSMVQLHAKGTKPDGSSHNGFGERRPAAVDDKEKQDKKRKAMARNKSWADDYHYSGW
ncbi:hypothetical protein BDZ97DRAFT_1650467 [Flammula alnicola]|nr:hypothetical protein BDZ97DRAFT_1650467 [Flammula alnicola]